VTALSRRSAAAHVADPVAGLLQTERATRTPVSVILSVIALLTFAFSFGNIWASLN
jgi:hypothetical protein